MKYRKNYSIGNTNKSIVRWGNNTFELLGAIGERKNNLYEFKQRYFEWSKVQYQLYSIGYFEHPFIWKGTITCFIFIELTFISIVTILKKNEESVNNIILLIICNIRGSYRINFIRSVSSTNGLIRQLRINYDYWSIWHFDIFL